MNKKWFSILMVLLLLVVFFAPISVGAAGIKLPERLQTGDGDRDGTEVYTRDSNQCFNNTAGEDPNDKLRKYIDDEAGIPDGIVASIVLFITNTFSGNSIPTLIFGNPYCEWSDSDELETMVFGVFTQKEVDEIIKPGMLVFSGTYVLFLTLAIMASSLHLSLRAASPKTAAEFGEDVRMYVMSALFMLLLWPFMTQIFIFNEAFINSIHQLIEKQGLNMDTFSMVTEGDYKTGEDIVLHMAEWVLTIIINVVFIARKIILLLVITLSPLSAIALLFRTTRSYFGVWVKIFIGVVFLASVASLSFYIFIMLTQVVTQVDSIFFKLAMFIMFIPLTTMAINWIGLDNSSTDVGKGTAGKAVSGARSLKSIATSKINKMNQS